MGTRPAARRTVAVRSTSEDLVRPDGRALHECSSKMIARPVAARAVVCICQSNSVDRPCPARSTERLAGPWCGPPRGERGSFGDSNQWQ
jgi:hypothetical protein